MSTNPTKIVIHQGKWTWLFTDTPKLIRFIWTDSVLKDYSLHIWFYISTSSITKVKCRNREAALQSIIDYYSGEKKMKLKEKVKIDVTIDDDFSDSDQDVEIIEQKVPEYIDFDDVVMD